MPEPIVEISEPEPGVVFVRLVGEFDLATNQRRLIELVPMRDSPPERLVIDAAGVTFLDSSGLRALLETAVEVQRNGGEVITEAASLAFRRVVQLSGLLEIFGLPPTEQRED